MHRTLDRSTVFERLAILAQRDRKRQVPPRVDMTAYRPQPGLQATLEADALMLRWEGASQQECLARFTVVDGVPTVRELAVRKRGGKWVTIGRNLSPEFGVATEVRRTGHGLSESNRWDVSLGCSA